MYYKEINGRIVFSDCKTICLSYDHPPRMKGQWVSNPDSQLIYDEDWREYTPPIVPPQPQTEPDMEQMIEAVKKMLSSSTEELSDEDALDVAALFPTWASKIGSEVAVGERLWYDGKLYKVIQAHTATELWTPDHNPALYTEISIEEWPEIPENIPSTAPWMKGDKGTWRGQHYICQLNNCTWNPDQYPAAWELVP